MANRRFVYSDNKQITAMHRQFDENYLWVGFALNSSGVCILEKQSSFSPDQTFFSIEKEVTSIVTMDSDAAKLYAAYDDDTLIGEFFAINNPLTTSTEISIPSGANEAPVDMKVDGSDLWFLLPGSLSGVEAALLKFTTSGSYVETIPLSGVVDATSMAIDSNSDIWIVTNTSPANVVRVFEISGGAYDTDITEIS